MEALSKHLSVTCLRSHMALVYQKYKRNAKSQVCFANNPVSGLLIVIGLFMGSPAVKSPLHHPIPSRQCRQRMSLIQLHRETFKVGRASLICSFAAYVLAKYCGMGEEQVQVSFPLISRSKLKFQWWYTFSILERLDSIQWGSRWHGCHLTLASACW